MQLVLLILFIRKKTKEEEIIYRQFPITCLENFNELDDELKQIKLSKVDVYDALVSFKFMLCYNHNC